MSRIGVSNFRPERLAQLLEIRNLKQSNVASMIGIGAATISKWLSGDQFPEIDTLDRLATTLNVESNWFTELPYQKLDNVNFRSNAASLKSSRVHLNARLNLANEISAKLEEFVDFPAVNFPSFEFQSIDDIDAQDIETAASTLRNAWGLGEAPIQDLALCFENYGGILVREETGISSIEGLSGWSPNLNRPFSLLNADKANYFRSRFDLAHEIGHLVLHRHIPDTVENYKLKENQAHKFAGALLLPAERFTYEVNSPINLNDLVVLKPRWGVSVAAMVMRLHSLSLLDDDAKTNMFKRISERWGRKSEPKDEAFKPELPRLLRRTIELLINEGVLGREAMSNFFAVSTYDIATICNISEVFLTETKIFDFNQLKLKRKIGTDNSGSVGSTETNLISFPSRMRTENA